MSSSRLSFGEAYMLCSDCGARLYSFDGNKDSAKPCPYKGTDKAIEYGCVSQKHTSVV